MNQVNQELSSDFSSVASEKVEALVKDGYKQTNPSASSGRVAKKGYKDTRVGIVPEDWEVKPVENIFEILRNKPLSRDNLQTKILSEYEIGNIHYGDIHAKYTSTRLNINETSIPTFSQPVINFDKKDFLKTGDIVMADASEDYTGVGASVTLFGVEDKSVVAGLHTFALRDKQDKFDNDYKQFVFEHTKVRNQLRRIATGSKVFGISKSNLKDIEIPLPPLPEQKKIAEILSTWDEAIEKQQRLIKSKKKLKKGLMQQLLTGKKRFKEFVKSDKFKDTKIGKIPEDWEVVRFEEISKLSQGLQIPITDRLENHEEDSLPYITVQWLNSKRKEDEYFIKSPRKSVVVMKDDILMTRTGNTGLVITNQYGVFHNNFFKIDYNRKKSFRMYLYYLLISDYYQHVIQTRAGSSTIPDLNHRDFYSVSIPLPPLPEQKKIAEVLSNADSEIELLEKELKKMQEAKKGLMQKLLTGEVRVKI